jgi:ornithine cyclodeaminase/alanine dehydrogenase-like protein (mu-crystallin family)
MRYLSAADITDLTTPATLIAALEQALRDFATGKVIVPTRGHTDFDGNTLLTMPVVGKGAFGTKTVSVIPSNADRGLPVISGLMTLHDRATGAPLAILDAAALTAQRTGAIGAIGLKHTTPEHTDTIGIIGAGTQATWQAIFACAVRPIRTIYFLARSDDKAQHLVESVSTHLARRPGESGDPVKQTREAPHIVRCTDALELLGKTDAIIAATTSNTPILPNEPALLAGKHFISIGSFKPSMQELPNTIYELAVTVIIDSDAAKHEVGDLINPLSAGILRDENIIHLADLVTGKHTIDIARTTAFKSVGNALYDLYAAKNLLAEAQLQDRGTSLERE